MNTLLHPILSLSRLRVSVQAQRVCVEEKRAQQRARQRARQRAQERARLVVNERV